jgi:hypothetical protein
MAPISLCVRIKPYGNVIVMWTVRLGQTRKMLTHAMLTYAN